MEATEHKHLPKPGGLLDQDEDLMDDLAAINAMAGAARKWLTEQGLM